MTAHLPLTQVSAGHWEQMNSQTVLDGSPNGVLSNSEMVLGGSPGNQQLLWAANNKAQMVSDG